MIKKYALAIALIVSSLCWSSDALELIISKEDISQKIQEIACQIDAECQGQELTVIMVMKGAVCVTADLIRALKTPTVLEYIKASSYGNKGMQRGELTINGLDLLDLTDKNILVVDDIFDSGHTMAAIVKQIQSKKPKSVKTFVALLKNVPRQISMRPDFYLFECENRFLIGYGLDYKEYYRNLPGVYSFTNDTPPADNVYITPTDISKAI